MHDIAYKMVVWFKIPQGIQLLLFKPDVVIFIPKMFQVLSEKGISISTQFLLPVFVTPI